MCYAILCTFQSLIFSDHREMPREMTHSLTDSHTHTHHNYCMPPDTIIVKQQMVGSVLLTNGGLGQLFIN